MKEIARAEYFAVTDEEAVDAFYLLSQIEGIIPALESAHAVAYALKLAPTMTAEERLVICLSGRGDKDVQQIKDRKEQRNDQQNIDDETKGAPKQGKSLFVPYIMAGANGLERLPAEIELLTTHGAAAIEIGVPFSDPVADGAVIQAAGIQALANGTTLKDHCCAANDPF